MNKTSLLLLLAAIAGFVFFEPLHASGNDTSVVITMDSAGFTDSVGSVVSIGFMDSLGTVSASDTSNSSIKKDVRAADQKKKKLVCALFAFPFPCGFVGAHRVMLGTSPWVPIVYVATFGGCFGLLPLIDFCFITFSKDITPFENNTHVFMWAK